MPITMYGDERGRMPTADLLAPPATSLPVPPAGDRAVWSAGNLHPPTLRELRERAAADLTAPWPVPLAHGYAQVVFARLRRLSRAAVMAAATLDPLWMDEVADGVTLVCEQSTWCWPA